MANRYGPPGTATAELAADYLDYRDEEIMQGLVTAGALVALADGKLEMVEREELVSFIDGQRFAPLSPRADIAEAFDSRVRELESPNCANVIAETLRPLTGRSLSSVVVRTSQKVATANRKIHPSELEVLKLIRRIMMSPHEEFIAAAAKDINVIIQNGGAAHAGRLVPAAVGASAGQLARKSDAQTSTVAATSTLWRRAWPSMMIGIVLGVTIVCVFVLGYGLISSLF